MESNQKSAYKLPIGRLVLEFFIVLGGVYVAFLLNNYGQSRRDQAQKEKVLIAIKGEVEYFRIFMSGQASTMRENISRWAEMYKADSTGEYYNWRFLEPQYNYEVLEYALNLENPDVINLELYQMFSAIYAEVRRLEQAERMMTQFATKYHPINEKLTSSDRDRLHLENKFSFFKFIRAAQDRARVLERLSAGSAGVLEKINAEFSPQRLKDIESEYLEEFLKDVDPEEYPEIKGMILDKFENFTEEDVDKIYEESKG